MGVVPLRSEDGFHDEFQGDPRRDEPASAMERIGEAVSNFFGRLGNGRRSKDPQFGLMDEVLAMSAMSELREVLGETEETMHDIETTRHAMQHYIDSKRVVLSQELTKPSWGPKISPRDFKRGKKKIGRSLANRARGLFGRRDDNANDRSSTLEPDYLMHIQDQEISFNLEQARRYSHFLWLYFAAALASVAIVIAALTVDYSILKEFWHQAMMNEYMMVPPELQDSVSLKALQVLFATIGIHLVLRHAPNWIVTMFTGVIFVMTVLMMIAIGFLYAHKTLPVENQATVAGQSTEESGLLGAFAESLGAGGSAADATAGGAAPKWTGVFNAETLAWVDAVGWLVALTAIFLVVASIGALFLLWGEHNIRNFILARDYSNRKYHTERLRYAESVALQVH
jgi:hypothetical protein